MVFASSQRRDVQEEGHGHSRDGPDNWLSGSSDRLSSKPLLLHRSSSDRGRGKNGYARGSTSSRTRGSGDGKDRMDAQSIPRSGPMPRTVGGSSKLGTFSGVFVPTTLNVLSILMFLRFGMILGQSGLIGMMGMLIASYVINLATTLSVSAIASNGTVRGGGTYYLISRSLGPEFGGSIGIVFYLGISFPSRVSS